YVEGGMGSISKAIASAAVAAGAQIVTDAEPSPPTGQRLLIVAAIVSTR
ncbi:hypothetical protein A2U01_0032000, partial [Trifolium medium]|nr:hypothetical protein [Trifolium medium]